MKKPVLILLCVTLPLLSGCALQLAGIGIAAATHGVFSDPDVNLKEKSYAAADLLTQNLNDSALRRQVLSIHNPLTVLMKPLDELDHTGITSPFGSAVPEWIGLRFAELGYTVFLHEVAPQGNKKLYPSPPAGAKHDLLITGTYAVKDQHVDVMLRVFDGDSGQVVTHFDYAMPLSREIKKLAETEIRIFRAN